MSYVKKHFKICVLFLCVVSICLVCPLRGYCSGLTNAWDTYYNWLVDLNYRKYGFIQHRLKMQYKNVRNFLDIATKIFTGEPLDHEGSHGGDGHSRDTAIVYNEEPVATPQPIYKNFDNSVYNPVTNNYEEISYYYEDNSSSDVYSFETTNNFITYEYNYTYYDIVVSPKESPTEGKFFKVYYELPDGRSSFNLTPDDIDGVIFNYDVINYERTVLDSDVIGIWHLDGDYFNSVTFTENPNIWNNNFVDGRFDGCVMRDASYTYNSNPSSTNKNFNNIYLYTDWTLESSDWTLEFWVWCPDPSSTLYQDSSGNYHRSKPSIFLFDSAPAWINVAVQSNGDYYVNGQLGYSSPFWQTSPDRNLNGWLDKFLTVYFAGSHYNIMFSYNGYSTPVQENGVTYYYDDMSTFAIDEVKFTKRLLYSGSNYGVRNEPYDLTFAYTVPDLDIDYSTIAIQSPITVGNAQIGGIRSSSPSIGDVFISLYDGRATSVSQYYDGSWNTVNGAVYLNGRWEDLLQYNFNTLMLEPDENVNNGATFIYNVYGGDSLNFIDVSGDDITISIDTSSANPSDVSKLLLGIPILFGFAGSVLGAVCPFLPAWLTGLIALGLGCVVTLILFVFIRRK